MTTQVWVPQRFTPDALTFVPPAQIDISQQVVNQKNQGTVPASGNSFQNTLIDLRQYVRKGRLPYKFTVNGLLDPCRYSKDRGMITVPSTVGGNMNLDVTVRDAYGNSVNHQIGVIVATGDLTVVAAYPAIHNGVPYDYTPLITGGNPPYNCFFHGLNFAALNMFFDTTSGRLQSASPTVLTTSLGNLWILDVTDTGWAITKADGSTSSGGNTTVHANGTIDLDNP
jgi:hypothetical protein